MLSLLLLLHGCVIMWWSLQKYTHIYILHTKHAVSLLYTLNIVYLCSPNGGIIAFWSLASCHPPPTSCHPPLATRLLPPASCHHGRPDPSAVRQLRRVQGGQQHGLPPPPAGPVQEQVQRVGAERAAPPVPGAPEDVSVVCVRTVECPMSEGVRSQHVRSS